LKRGLAGLELRDLGPGAPLRAETDEHRHHERAGRQRQGGAETDGEAVDDSARTIGDEDGEATTEHTRQKTPVIYRRSWWRSEGSRTPCGTRLKSGDSITRV